MEELVKTKYYLQGDQPTRLWGKVSKDPQPQVRLLTEGELKPQPFSAPYTASMGSNQ